ncbi:MAG: hypothetical protein PQ612_07355 [Rickettsiales bacterium]|nr:hypothetical protein [Pseudomonadota bacterium]MDA0965717.1 hypothetical protein [Pseudomonadota bacterium]MDG4543821.1 hypothetical protein [Rickettsiales bacterium]MDG4545968.1 hypothetical protein [Rickettsiales bacterium]MDG4548214.1 hypothetical protein [Rickettsiales bacterium]
MPTEKNSKIVNGNPVEITSSNDKLTDAQLQKNYEASRNQFKEKYGVDFNNVKTRAKREKDVKSTKELVGEGKKHSKDEFQQDFNSLKEAFVAKGSSFKFSDLEAYSNELTKQKFLEPEKEIVKEKTPTQKFLQKARATGGELAQKLQQRGKTEATHVTQGTSYDNLYTKEQFEEYQASNQVLIDKYGIDIASNTKMTDKQVKEQLIPKLKNALEPEGSSPEQIQKNKVQFKKDLDKHKAAFTERFSEPDQLSTISRLENSEYLQEIREQKPDTPSKAASTSPKAAKQLEGIERNTGNGSDNKSFASRTQSRNQR